MDRRRRPASVPTVTADLAVNQTRGLSDVEPLMSNDKLYRTCVQCDNPFYITARDQTYLLGRGLELPKRCFACRKRNKMEAARQLQQSPEKDPAKWEEVWKPTKKKD